ncbi:MAG: 3-hydroxyacyl-CoA dehydrogenase NAD-binding domain-containing protein, partial [Paracoccaceae bacterium]
MYPDPSSVTRITTLGAGPIGGGWAAHFLARGYDVTAYIHSEAERPALMAVIDTGWISLEALGLATGASRDRLTVTTDLDAAIRDAQFIQESAPERLELKQALYKRLGEVAPKDCIIASSTSGLMMTDI